MVVPDKAMGLAGGQLVDATGDLKEWPSRVDVNLVSGVRRPSGSRG
jgi:hypothetical protein